MDRCSCLRYEMFVSRTRDTGGPKTGARSGRSAPEKARRDPQSVFSSLLTPSRERDYTQVAITLPRSHMRILTTEAGLYGLRRSQLLEMLLLNQMGQKILHRLPSAPTYQLTREELTETERFLWVMSPAAKKAFEAHIVQFGLKPSAWVITALNAWTGMAAK
jgi:hypothetical protein